MWSKTESFSLASINLVWVVSKTRTTTFPVLVSLVFFPFTHNVKWISVPSGIKTCAEF